MAFTDMPRLLVPSLFQSKQPFVNKLQTKLVKVKEIPYFVTDRFLHTYYRNLHQLKQVEEMVEKAYEQYLSTECNRQVAYKRQLEQAANSIKEESERNRKLETAKAFELTRCSELHDLFVNDRNDPQQRTNSNGFARSY
jgi:hypothetical protein